MKKGDIALIITALLLLVIWLFPSQGGEYAAIYVDGELLMRLPLDENCEKVIESEFGKNTVVVKGGVVTITHADCPDKLCQKGKLDKDAHSIVCLPNRLSIIIEGAKSKEKIDVVI